MANARSASDRHDPPFGWSDFARVVSRRRGAVFWVALVTVAATAAVMMSLPTLFTADAVVMLDQQKNSVADSSSVLSALPNDAASVQNQIQILTSRDLAAKVVDRLHLTEDAEFNPARGAPGPLAQAKAAIGLGGGSKSDPREGAIDTFLKGLDVSALGLSTSISVGFTARDPAKAANIANATVDLYVQGQIETRTRAAKKTAAWLNARIDQLSHQLEEEEIAAETYKSEHNLVDSGQAASLIEQQMAAITAQMVTAQSDLAAKQAVYQRAQSLMRDGRPADLSQVVSSDLMVKLHTEEAELVKQEADYASRYGANHPKMIAVRTQKRDLETKIAQEAARLTGAMASDVAVARAHFSSLEASLKQAGQASRGDNLARVTLNALQAKAASTRQMYESFVSKLRAIQDPDAIQNAESRVISHAAPPAAPSAPHRLLFIAAALPLGVMLGILWALILERAGSGGSAPMEPRIGRTPEPPMLPPVLANLPAAATVLAADAIFDAPTSQYAAAVTALASRLAGAGRVTHLHAPVADPVASVLALGMARAAARRGMPVLVIETSSAFLLPSLGVAMPVAGLGEVLTGGTVPTAALVCDPRSAVRLLPPGRVVSSVGAPIERNFLELLASFRKSGVWTLIVGAAPPASGDESVLVVRADADQAGLVAAVRASAARGGKLSGLIVAR